MKKHYFAQLNDNNQVIKVIILGDRQCCYADGEHSEKLGVEYCKNTYGQDTIWVETYRGFPGHGPKGHHAGIGMTYMTGVQTLGVGSTDVFMRTKPYDSWVVGINTAEWYSPIGGPPELSEEEISQRKYYEWDEDNQSWILMDN